MYLSPFFTAWLLMLLASDPAFGSVNPNAPIFSPCIPGTRYFSFCSSFPNLYIGNIERLVWALTHIAIPAFILPISSEKMQSVTLSNSTPPYFSGKTMPSKPISPSLGKSPSGNFSLFSASSTSGSISFSPKSTIISLNILCSSVNSKSSGNLNTSSGKSKYMKQTHIKIGNSAKIYIKYIF